MKRFGAHKATEFSKKQIGAVYGKAKAGELKIERWYMSRLYDLADYYGYDDNGSMAEEEQRILRLIDLVFAGKLAEAQEFIDEEQEHVYSLLGRKAKEQCNRDII